MKDAIVILTCLWFVVLSVVALTNPQWVGSWQAKAEMAFVVEADKIGLWSE